MDIVSAAKTVTKCSTFSARIFVLALHKKSSQKEWQNETKEVAYVRASTGDEE